ncbi:MAG: 5-methylthioadenosine/S-adenosylhomocysteine deaminase [Smithella sp. PtaU1.Bin162]|nr:MAG: 5-methylthioadenosine/S-adenosylhomocysteine deaminase [Smithella sp. PtaU1.Bin162]
MQTNGLDIIITGGTLLTMSGKMEILENPVVGIKNGVIVSIETTAGHCNNSGTAKEIIDASGCIIMPGLVNTHTHLPMVCFRGMADDLPLSDWLNHHIFPAEARFAGKKMVYAGALLAMAEMILSGTTTFCDGYFFEGKVGEAALQTGMRAVIAQGFLDFPTPDNPDPLKKMTTAGRFHADWKDVSPLITPAFFCHAPYTCSPETLTIIKEASRNAGLLFFIHLLENKDEGETIRHKYGKKPVQLLQSLGILDKQTIAVHCNWVDNEDMAVFADSGVKVSHNPESSMKLAAGVAPIPAMLKRGIAVGLGTDGAASNNDLDMFREMDTAAKIHKVVTLDPTVMSAETVLKMATIGGAGVLGLADRIGSIEVGKEADIIIMDMSSPHLTPLYNCYSHLVYAASGTDVKTSIIGGKIIMKNRQLLTLDVDSAMENVRKIAADIMLS